MIDRHYWNLRKHSNMTTPSLVVAIGALSIGYGAETRYDVSRFLSQ